MKENHKKRNVLQKKINKGIYAFPDCDVHFNETRQGYPYHHRSIISGYRNFYLNENMRTIT